MKRLENEVRKDTIEEGIGLARGAAELMPADMGYVMLEAEDKGNCFEWNSGRIVFYDPKTRELLRSQGVGEAGLIKNTLIEGYLTINTQGAKYFRGGN